jgi:hypothetical protein
LENLVARIALYPDPLLAQILTASTFWDEIPEAAAWANEHSYLKGDALAEAIRTDNLQWDPSVLALLPFPSVLNMMAQDLAWTEKLGTAVLAQRADVMDAVQRLRRKAREFGYLHTNPYCTVVENDGYVEDPSGQSRLHLRSRVRSAHRVRATSSRIRYRGCHRLGSGRGDYRRFFFRGAGHTLILDGAPTPSFSMPRLGIVSG